MCIKDGLKIYIWTNIPVGVGNIYSKHCCAEILSGKKIWNKVNSRLSEKEKHENTQKVKKNIFFYQTVQNSVQMFKVDSYLKHTYKDCS